MEEDTHLQGRRWKLIGEGGHYDRNGRYVVDHKLIPNTWGGYDIAPIPVKRRPWWAFWRKG